MKRFKYIIALLGLFIMVISCGKEDLVETDAELQPYFDLFAEEAAKRGFVVDYDAERIEGLLQDIPNTSIQGQCFHNENIPKKVVIDVTYWENASKLEKEFIIYHELGHCFLDRGHLDDSDGNGLCVSIMHSSPGVCNFSLTPTNRDSYLDELFFN